jgi:hypothetical protein
MAKPVKQSDPLTLQQLYCIELLLVKDIKRVTMAEIAGAVGVSERTIQRWRHLPEFRTEYKRRAVEVLGDNLPLVLGTLEKKALSGNVKALELYLRVTGVLRTELDITARPAPPVQERSDESIDREIEALERELGLLPEEENYKEGDK